MYGQFARVRACANELRVQYKGGCSNSRRILFRMVWLTVETPERVVALKAKGYKVTEIRARLLEEGTKVSFVTLYKWFRTAKRIGSVASKPRIPSPKRMTQEQYEFIDDQMSLNDELSARQLRDVLLTKWPCIKKISISTVKRARRHLGSTISWPKYCQLIRETNLERRLQWCQEQLQNSELLQDFVNLLKLDCCLLYNKCIPGVTAFNKTMIPSIQASMHKSSPCNVVEDTPRKS